VVFQRKKVHHSGNKHPKEWIGTMSRVQTWAVDGYSVKDNQKKIHGLLKFLRRLQSIIAPFTKSKASGNKSSV